MSRDWALFWVAMSVMALAGAIVSNVVWGAPMQMGPLGQWASAAASTLAVVVALLNTQSTLRATEDRERRKQVESDRIYVRSVESVALMVKRSVDTAVDVLSEGALGAHVAQEIVKITNFEGVLGAIDRFPLHTAPEHGVVVVLTDARTVALNCMHKLTATSPGSPGTKINLAPEKEFIDATCENIAKLIQMRYSG